MKKIILILLSLLFVTGCGMATVPPPNVNTVGFNTYNSSPYNCTINTEGHIFSNTILNVPCYCNKTNWISMKNFSQVCN